MMMKKKKRGYTCLNVIKLTNKNVYTVTKGNRDSHSAGQTCKNVPCVYTCQVRVNVGNCCVCVMYFEH